jgi:hypothetical protein
MTKHRILLTLTALVLTAPVSAQKLSSEKLDGRWTGSAAFFKPDLAEKIGELTVELEFKSGELVAGTVGSARVARAKVAASRSILQLTSKLTGRIGSVAELDKEYFILLVTAVSDSNIKAEFHLKSNRAFDPKVREGWVILRRAGR